MAFAVNGIELPRLVDIGCAMSFVLYRLSMGQARAAFLETTFVNNYVMPPDGEPFDLITEFDVIGNVIEYRAMIANIDRILTPNGRLIFIRPIVRIFDYDVTHHNKCFRRA